MEIGFAGLGKMGMNMVTRLQQGRHRVVAYDRSPDVVKQAESKGCMGAASLSDLVSKLAAPRAVWVMVPSGAPTEETIPCNLGSLASSGSATVDITVRPDNTGSTILSRGNTASVNSPDVGDPNRNNNSVTISSKVTPLVDLTVAKTVTPNPVKVGEPLVYVVTARNNGPSQASNVKITDVLPANTAMLGTATATNGGTCTAPADGATTDLPRTGTDVLCRTLDPLLSG